MHFSIGGERVLYEKIEKLCREGGLSIASLERECGLANATIKGWKKCSPTVANLAKVADRLNVTIDYLVGREGCNNPNGA